MEKGKKDPAEYERDLENAEDVYADECRRLQRKADRLEEALEADIDSLKQLVAVQLDYARRYVALLEDCESSIGSLPSACALLLSLSSRSRAEYRVATQLLLPSSLVDPASPAQLDPHGPLAVRVLCPLYPDAGHFLLVRHVLHARPEPLAPQHCLVADERRRGCPGGRGRSRERAGKEPQPQREHARAVRA